MEQRDLNSYLRVCAGIPKECFPHSEKVWFEERVEFRRELSVEEEECSFHCPSKEEIQQALGESLKSIQLIQPSLYQFESEDGRVIFSDSEEEGLLMLYLWERVLGMVE